jgi:hypothetical protein
VEERRWKKETKTKLYGRAIPSSKAGAGEKNRKYIICEFSSFTHCT